MCILGMATKGYDCIQIPGAEKADGTPVLATRQCGRTNLPLTANDGASTTVCSKYTVKYSNVSQMIVMA